METVEHQMAPVSGASTKRMRPVITVVAARPMSEVGFRAVQASNPVVNQASTNQSDNTLHHPNQADEAMQSRLAPPVRPRIIRPSFTQEGTEAPTGQHVIEPPQKSVPHPAVSLPAKPAKPQRLTPTGHFVPPVPLRSHVPVDQHDEENMVNDYLERTSPVTSTPAPTSRRPTIISPVRSSKVQSSHTDQVWSTDETAMSESKAPARTMHKTRPTIIGFPRHQTHPQGERRIGSQNGSQDMSLTGSCTNGNNGEISEKTHKVSGFLLSEAIVARKGIKERYNTSPLNPHQSESEAVKANPVAAQARAAPLVKAKPSLAPKPQLKPKPGFQRARHTQHGETQQMSPTLTAESVEKATAPVVEKATKKTFNVVQKHTEKSVQQAIMSKFVTPHLGSSQFVQKRTAPLVKKATDQMYSSAEKQAEASAQKAIVSTVVGHQAQSLGTTHGTTQSGPTQALPTGFMGKTVTASSVEKATAPTVEKATKQSFSIIQKHTEKSMQQAIMSKVVTPHLGSSKFVQQRTAPLVEKATNQMYSSAEKQAEASVQKAIVTTVVGVQPGVSEPEQTTRAVPIGTSQAVPTKMSAMAKSTLKEAHMSSPLRNGSEGHSGHSTPNLTSVSSRSGRAAESPDVPVARRKSIAGSIKSKLARARPKSMNFDVLKHKNEHADHGKRQPRVDVHDDMVQKKHPPPRPATGPLRAANKLLPTARSNKWEDSQWASGYAQSPPKYDHGLAVSPPKYDHHDQTTQGDIPHGVAVYDYAASQPDELSFQTGDRVTLLRKVDDQWFFGEIQGKEGIFPSGFIDVLVPIPDYGNVHTMGDAAYPNYPPHNQPVSDYPSSNEHNTESKQGEDNCSGVKAAALYTFVGEPGELSFVTGAAICVHGKLTPDWLYGELYGEYGRFPASFVSVTMETLPQLDLDSVGGVVGHGTAREHNKEESGFNSSWEDNSSNIPNSWVTQDKGHGTPSEPLQEATYCIALHPFSGKSGEDLVFEAGDRITLLAYVDSDWLKGSLSGREGIFPKAFVDIIEGSSKDVTDTAASATVYGNMTSAEAAPTVATNEEMTCKAYATEFSGSVARALFDFTGDTEEDLCFKCGQDIEVLEWINNDWLKGRFAGRTGIFPANFVEIIE